MALFQGPSFQFVFLIDDAVVDMEMTADPQEVVTMSMGD